MEFLPDDLQKYVEDHSEPESDLLQQINRETHLHVLKPRMLSGHLQGRVLSMLSHMIRPKNILEIGTYTGYAALCMAEGMQADGRLITIDNNDELALRTKEYFDQSAWADQIDLRVGNALEVIPTLKEKWDLVFIDADKENYANYFDLVINSVNTGGFIIADNVLWSGKVFDKSKNDKDTEAIRAFNQKTHTDRRVQNVLFPIRDGLMILRKL
ncbi:Predicted O-methyltransferase YrrM [Ekhidna lutea]|uniref:Predicted O-methyltransferase YrrM n=1 Tax=Ekhidna lutea TaxID=447679 RepID=A0A239JJX8_EKHLU|nr:O-methyltransferase [Ekhidna lutea]SNT06110.1 Predicted O-methyltransferase YrrM [Ekhidna lutea]